MQISLIRVVLLGLFGLVGFAVDYALMASGATGEADTAAFQIGMSLRDGPVGASALMFTLLGTGPGLVGVAVLAALVMRSRGEWIWTGLLPLSLLLVWVANPTLKCAFLRERPSADLIVPTFTSCDIYAFPSGHAMHSAALFGVLMYWAATRRESYRGWIVAILALFPLFIGLSRIVLGVHWLSDVVGGWLAGLVIVSVVMLTGQWIVLWQERRKGQT